MLKSPAIAAGCCLLFALPSLAQPPSAAPATGIDWASDAITVVGAGQPPPNPSNLAQARAMAIRSAIVDAQRNLTSIVRGIAIQGDGTVGSAMSSNELVRTKVEGLLKAAWQIGQPNYLPDGSITLTIGVRRSDLANALLPDGGFAPASPPATPPPAGVLTGLVIDVRGLNLTPALLPRVLDDKGGELYGPSFVTRDFAVRNGGAGYAKDARKSERVGGNPLFVRAAGAAGPNRTDVILSAEDSGRVRSAAQTYNFLAQGRVLLLID